MSAVKMCALSELTEGEAKAVSEDPPIALYLVDGEVFATSNICSHDKFFLAEGYLEGGRIECAWHFAQFCVRTGAPLTPPASEPIATYEVSVRDGDVYVDLPD